MNREVRNMRLDLIASCSFSLFYLLFSLPFFAFLNIARKKKKKKNISWNRLSMRMSHYPAFLVSFISIPFVLPVHSNMFEFHLVRQ